MRKKCVKTEATAPLDNEYKLLNAFLFFWEDASVVSSNFQEAIQIMRMTFRKYLPHLLFDGKHCFELCGIYN